MSVELQLRSAGRTRRLPLLLATAALAVVVLAVLFPGLLTAHAPDATDVLNALRPPSSAHPFGTDELGRDVYSRVVYGARISLFTGAGAVAIGVGGGVLLGLVCALAGPADRVLMRLIDVLLAFPELLLALLVVALLGRGSVNVAVAIGLAAVPHFARLVRGQALAVSRSEYVEAARILGVPPWRYLLRHVLPNVAGPLVVLACIGTGSAITAAAGLSVLGLGPQAPSPQWGAQLADGEGFLSTAWWVATFPGLVLVIVVMAVTLIGRSRQSHPTR